MVVGNAAKKSNVSFTPKTSEELTPKNSQDMLTKDKSNSKFEFKQEENKHVNESKTSENINCDSTKLLPKLLQELQQMTKDPPFREGVYAAECGSEIILIEEFEIWLKVEAKLYQ